MSEVENPECWVCHKRLPYCKCAPGAMPKPKAVTSVPQTPPTSAEIQAARDRLLELATATAAETQKPVALPKARRAECAQCRGTGWVWLVDPRTLQKEVGNCPACGVKPPALPENSHKNLAKPARRGFQHYLRA
ncbi:MAG: hypothetical protein E6R03_16475 [Hyphomicrobiaceae bacterium]|nr:MAG: hypothetical protein E6R03_16475 [Hyphomicrobiaceae bacterium]